MADTDEIRQKSDEGQGVWHKLNTGELINVVTAMLECFVYIFEVTCQNQATATICHLPQTCLK